jgi:ornithine cyclodeaminase/alanine dehydrogenase-like protein (mu-crystallin family)
MDILVLGHDAVTELLSVTACIPVMRETLAGLARGDGFQPLRTVVRPPGLGGFTVLMPAFTGAGAGGPGTPAALGVKVLGIFPGNPALGKDAHQGMVLLQDTQTGQPRAIVNASAVTAVRTAAVSAVATDALARPDATTLTVFGTGVQAGWHVRAIAAVRSLQWVRLVGRDAARGAKVAAGLADELGRPVTFSTDGASACDGAGVVVTVTNSATPVLRHDWLTPGTHVNAVGACVPTDRELDTATVAGSRFFVDRSESALSESGDFRIAAQEAGFGPEHIEGELGDVLSGVLPGRVGDELTVFESLGLAIEDVAAVDHLVREAVRRGLGSRVEF